MLLEDVLEKEGGWGFKIRHLLWMIYEGNDLEDNYETLRAAEEHALRDLFAGTVLEHLLMLPLTTRDEAIINKLQNGQIRLNGQWCCNTP